MGHESANAARHGTPDGIVDLFEKDAKEPTF
jgi:hypothetical protein